MADCEHGYRAAGGTFDCPACDLVVFQVERGCDAARAGIGCGCTGQCHELSEVVPASEYYRLLGRIEQLERSAQ
jgi:hypothetical protein